MDDEFTLDYDASSASDSLFTDEVLRDMAPLTTAAMMTSGDIFQIELDLNETTGMDIALEVQEQISVLLMPKHGVPTLVEISAPSTLEASSVVVLK